MPPTELAPADAFDSLTDRELLLTIVRDMATIRALMVEVTEQAAPLIGMVSKNPMLKLLLK